jgi:hypothetical protein
MVDCCHLVGNFYRDTPFDLADCFISVNNTVNTDVNDYGCGELSSGARIGTLNLSGYAGTTIYTGCPGRAGVQVLWMRKFRCDTEQTHFIFLGPGRSFMHDSVSSYLSLGSEAEDSTDVITASSQSGPTSLFTMTKQTEGLGMYYSKGPIVFDTSSESGCTMPNMGIGNGPYYLQTFNIELVPGAIPVASYTFAYNA